MRMMGAESVAYHERTVLGRADDFERRALAYYASRGETPLRWGGRGAHRLGLVGEVTGAQYAALFGPGGASDPTTGERLVAARRPGMELVVAAHKSVALLGLIGRAEHMHQILDAESHATIAALDSWMARRGGRRGRAQSRTETSGLIWARTRHATSRAGDPAPHDHVLVANVTEMADAAGGWKALDTAALRDLLHAATAVGRVAAARKAVELGYPIEPDDGPSGRLGHWRIAGVPKGAEEVFSKRAAEIDEHMGRVGYQTDRARQVAARASRDVKRHTPPDQLMPGWLAELDAAGHPVREIAAAVDRAAAERAVTPDRLSVEERRRLVADLLDPDGPLAARKVFGRTDVVVAAGPLLFGYDPGELPAVVNAVVRDAEVIPLVGVAGARDRAYTTAHVVARETAIAAAVAERISMGTGPVLPVHWAVDAIVAKERELGRPLTDGQRDAIVGICTSGRGVELVLGVAGAGKTTALDAVRSAFEAAGYRVVGTATSGQAARTLHREAQVGEARTLASLIWRLDHHQLHLDDRTLLMLDEAGMTDDPGILRLVVAANTARAKLVMVGDNRQLSAVGPGGALGALLDRHPEVVHRLDENVRQADPGERRALAELRSGDVARAVAWYAANDRLRLHADRDDALDAIVTAWSVDVAAGRETAMLAWRRANVAELNRRARETMAETGRLSGPELIAPGSRAYRAGDRVVTLAPGANGRLVTSERGTVTAVTPATGAVTVRMDEGATHHLSRDETAADRLDHAYAITVHRSQGATLDTVHRFEDGGGRELAYVALSRARHRATAHLVADDRDQAVDDLRRDWSAERRQAWAVDTGTPTRDPLTAEADPQVPERLRASLRHARLQTERDALVAAIPTDRRADLTVAGARLHRAVQDRDDLTRGYGRWQDTPQGAVAAALAEARAHRAQAETFARDPLMSRKMRRTWKRDAGIWAARETTAQAGWDRDVAPTLARLDTHIGRLEDHHEQLRGAVRERDGWLDQHPEAVRRVRDLNTELAHLSELLQPDHDRAAAVAAPARHVGRDQPRRPYAPVVPVRAVDHGIDLGR